MVNITIYILYLNLSPPSVFRIENLGMFWSSGLFSSARGLGAAGGYPHCFWVKAGLQHALIAVLFCFLFFFAGPHWKTLNYSHSHLLSNSGRKPGRTNADTMQTHVNCILIWGSLFWGLAVTLWWPIHISQGVLEDTVALYGNEWSMLLRDEVLFTFKVMSFPKYLPVIFDSDSFIVCGLVVHDV